MASDKDNKKKDGGSISTSTKKSPPSTATPPADNKITALAYLTAHADRSLFKTVRHRKRAAQTLKRAAMRRFNTENLTVKQWQKLAGGAK